VRAHAATLTRRLLQCNCLRPMVELLAKGDSRTSKVRAWERTRDVWRVTCVTLLQVLLEAIRNILKVGQNRLDAAGNNPCVKHIVTRPWMISYVFTSIGWFCVHVFVSGLLGGSEIIWPALADGCCRYLLTLEQCGGIDAIELLQVRCGGV